MKVVTRRLLRSLLLMDIKNGENGLTFRGKLYGDLLFFFFVFFLLFSSPTVFGFFLVSSRVDGAFLRVGKHKTSTFGSVDGVCLMYVPSRSCGVGGGYGLGKGSWAGMKVVSSRCACFNWGWFLILSWC